MTDCSYTYGYLFSNETSNRPTLPPPTLRIPPPPVRGSPARSAPLARPSPHRVLRRRQAGYPVARYRNGATHLPQRYSRRANQIKSRTAIAFIPLIKCNSALAPWPSRTAPADANMRPARAVLPRPPRASFINASLILSPSRRQQSGQVSKVYLSSDRADQGHLSTSPTTTGRSTWPAHAREHQLPRTAVSCYGSWSSICGMFMGDGVTGVRNEFQNTTTGLWQRETWLQKASDPNSHIRWALPNGRGSKHALSF